VGAEFLRNFVLFVLIGLQIVILARVVLSFVDPRGTSPVGAFIVSTTEPILGPVRRLLPRTGMFDLSPLIVLLVLGAISRAVS
jgi:YggT family protein